MRRLARSILFVLGLSLANVASPQQQDSPALPSKTLAIPLIEINGRAEELHIELRDIGRRLPGKSVLADRREALKHEYQSVNARLRDTDDLLANNPTLVDVRGEERYWRAYERNSPVRRAIVDFVQETNRAVSSLERHEEIWQATLQEIALPSGVPAVNETVRQSLSGIQQLKGDALEQRGLALTLQNEASRLDLQSRLELDKVEAALAKFQEHLFSKEGYPLWQYSLRRKNEVVGSQIDQAMRRSFAKSKDFLAQERRGFLILIIFYLANLAGILRLRKTFLNVAPHDVVVSKALELTKRPFTLVFFITLPFAIPVLRRAPMGVMSLTILFLLCPLFIMSMHVWRSGIRRSLWLIAALFLANGLLDVLILSPELKRDLMALLALVSAAAFAWLAWRRSKSEAFSARRQKILTFAICCMSAGFVSSLLANLFGYLTLSQVLRQTTLISVFTALLIFVAVYSIVSIGAALIHSTRLKRLSVVQTHGETIKTWLSRIVSAIGVWFWLFTTLDLLNIKNEFREFLTLVMTARIPLPAVDFSLGDVVIFTTVVTIGYAFASVIRLTLRKDVLTRFRLDRGIPDLIASSVYYVLLVFVFVTAISAIGVRLDRFTLLTGAIGVGLGFGLQNVVNNFASGLILQFERPINLGDALEVGDVSGAVSRIGVRSSTIVTGQGAEVIIPNATLVSGQVTNWTLHHSYRRVEIPVRVAYGADPRAVNELLLDMAARNSEVLRDPAPAAIFKGFGENALEFELMFWTANSTHPFVRSDVGISILDALRDKGIEIPLPQREIRLSGFDIQNHVSTSTSSGGSGNV